MGIIGDLYYDYLLNDREEQESPIVDKLEATKDDCISCDYDICSECMKETCINKE